MCMYIYIYIERERERGGGPAAGLRPSRCPAEGPPRTPPARSWPLWLCVCMCIYIYIYTHTYVYVLLCLIVIVAIVICIISYYIIPYRNLCYMLRSVFIISNRKISNLASQILKASMLLICPYCLKFQIARV